jgi:hypothetical protein
MRRIITNSIIRWSKVMAMVVATIVAITAYQIDQNELIYYANGSNNFDIRISFFCMVLTILVTIEYWKDWLLRIVAGTVALMCINNYFDELLFNPLVFEYNEKAFLVIITINLLHSIWSNQTSNTTD